MGFDEVFSIALEPSLPPGDGYLLRIERVQAHRFTTGTRALRVTFRVEQAPAPHEATVDKTITDSYPLERRGAALAVPLLAACGIPIVDDRGEFTPDDLVGKQVKADFVAEEFENGTRTRVRRFRKPTTEK